METGEHIAFMALGGADRIGASSYLLRIADTTVLIDFGIDPKGAIGGTVQTLLGHLRSNQIISSLDALTAVVLTHAHLDHAGLLPALFREITGALKPTQRKPRFYTSKATMNLLPFVYRNILRQSENVPYSEPDVEALLRALLQTDTDGAIDWFDPTKGKIWFYETSHLLGAVMVEIEVNQWRAVYTGDLQIGATPTLLAGKEPRPGMDLLVVDGTYAGAGARSTNGSWERAREELFCILDETLGRGGTVLLPSFALGRSQDVLALVLEHGLAHPELNYYVYLDGQSRKITRDIYPSFRSHLSSRYLDLYDRAAWRIRWVEQDTDLRSLMTSDMAGYPAVVIASSGMLLPHSASRRWAEAIMNNPNHTIAVTGYVDEEMQEEIFGEGRVGNSHLLSRPQKVGISGHASLEETKSFISRMVPKAVIIVHCGGGDLTGKGSLHAWLQEQHIPAAIARPGAPLIITGEGIGQ